MGVVIRQGFKHSIVTFLTIGIGMINVLLIYTAVLSKEELGLIQYVLAAAQLLLPVIVIGFDAVSIRFFSIYKERNKQIKLLYLVLGLPFISFILFTALFYLCYDDLLNYFYLNHPDFQLIEEYFLFVPLILFALSFSRLLSSFISNYKRIVVPAILNNLWIKVAVPSCAIAYYLDYLTFYQLFWFITISYLLSVIGLLIYLVNLQAFHIEHEVKTTDLPLAKTIGSFALFSVLGIMSSLLINKIDTFMVGSLIDMGNAGIYTIAIFISTVIEVPLGSIAGIATPIIATALAQKDLETIDELYKKSALNLSIIGIFLFTLIWSSIDLLFDIIPNGDEYRAGKYVVLFLGLAKLVDMATSINTHIIIYSQYYRFNLYISLFLGILNICFNLLFIPYFDMLGVAIATLISMIIYNFTKFLFVYSKFKMQPFSWNMLIIVLLGLMCYSLVYFLPNTNNSLVDIFINSSVISFFYISIVLYFDLSPDITSIKQALLMRIKDTIKYFNKY